MADDLAYRSPLVEVCRTPDRGRGVFAVENIAHGTLIERTPVILLPADEVLGEASPTLSRYVFDWRPIAGSDVVAVALGLGSLYNHDWPANADWRPMAPDLLEIVAVRDIPAGREITINYRGEPDDPEPITFS